MLLPSSRLVFPWQDDCFLKTPVVQIWFTITSGLSMWGIFAWMTKNIRKSSFGHPLWGVFAWMTCHVRKKYFWPSHSKGLWMDGQDMFEKGWQTHPHFALSQPHFTLSQSISSLQNEARVPLAKIQCVLEQWVRPGEVEWFHYRTSSPLLWLFLQMFAITYRPSNVAFRLLASLFIRGGHKDVFSTCCWPWSCCCDFPWRLCSNLQSQLMVPPAMTNDYG